MENFGKTLTESFNEAKKVANESLHALERDAMHLKDKLSSLARVVVTVPPNASPGSPLAVFHQGFKFQVIVPPGAVTGSKFVADLPIALAQKQKAESRAVHDVEKQLAEAEAHGEECREIFSRFDVNHDGVLDYVEFTQFLKSLGLPDSYISVEIAKADINNDHEIEFGEFVTYYNILKHNISAGNMDGSAVPVKILENPFPKALPENDCNVVCVQGVGVCLVSKSLKHKITIQFSSLQNFSVQNQRNVVFRLIPSKGGGRIVVECDSCAEASEVVANVQRAISHNSESHLEQEQKLQAERDELEQLRAELHHMKKTLSVGGNQYSMVNADLYGGEDNAQGVEAKVEVLISSGERAAEYHAQSTAHLAEKKRQALQARLAKRKNQVGAGQKRLVQEEIIKVQSARRASVVVAPPKKADFI